MYRKMFSGIVNSGELIPDKIKKSIPSIIDVQHIVVKRNNVAVITNTLI